MIKKHNQYINLLASDLEAILTKIDAIVVVFELLVRKKAISRDELRRQVEALDAMDRSLMLRQRYFGTGARETRDACRVAGEMSYDHCPLWSHQAWYQNAPALANPARSNDPKLALTCGQLMCAGSPR